MSFEEGVLIFLMVATLYALWWAGSALRRGSIKQGTLRYARSGQPAEYWFHVLSALIFPSAITAFMFYQYYSGLDRRVPVGALLIVISLSFWLVRGLQTGTTGFAHVELVRQTEAGLYWGFMTFMAASIALVALLIAA